MYKVIINVAFMLLAMTSCNNEIEVINQADQTEEVINEFKPTERDLIFVRKTYQEICDIYPNEMPKCSLDDFWAMYDAIWFAYHHIDSFADTYMEGDGWDNFMEFVDNNNIEL